MKTRQVLREDVQMSTGCYFPLKIFDCENETTVFDPYKGTLRRFGGGRGAIFFYPEEDNPTLAEFLEGLGLGLLIRTVIADSPSYMETLVAYHWEDWE
jgi:hypothetical protein